MSKDLDKVLESLQTVSLVMPFLTLTIGIIRAAIAAGRDTVSLQELQDAWQGNLDKVDSKGRQWLKDHGFDLPPEKPPTS
jgi:hypothetical protein